MTFTVAFKEDVNLKKCIRLFFFMALYLLLCGCSGREQILEDIDALRYVDLAGYNNIEVNKEYTEISESDVGNIIMMDLSSDEKYIEVNSRKNVADGDILLLLLSFADNKESCEYYCEVGNDETFSNDTEFINRQKEDEFHSEITISDENVEVLIKIMGIYRYPTLSDTDLILDYYNCETMDDVECFVRNRAEKEIVYNYIWDYILNNSTIRKYPKFIKNEIESQKERSETASQSIDYDEQSASYYREILIAKALLEKEKISVTDENIKSTTDELCEKLEVNSEEINLFYTDEEIYYRTVMNLLRKTIVPMVKIVE